MAFTFCHLCLQILTISVQCNQLKNKTNKTNYLETRDVLILSGSGCGKGVYVPKRDQEQIMKVKTEIQKDALRG